MGFSLSKITGRAASVAVTVDGETLTAHYNPAAFTPKLQAEVKGATDEASVLVTMLHRLLTGWDLEDNGQPYPITTEALMELPVPFLAQVLQAITEDLAPNPTKPATTGSF